MSGTSPGQRREWAAILVLAGLVGLGPLVVAAARDLAVPLGSDAPLWGLSVLDAAHGRQASLPPLFGQLAAVLHLAGLSAGTAARVVSSLSLGLTCLLAAGVARAAGARTGGALVAALLVAGHPDLFLSALLTQPDVVATAAFSAVAVALALAAGAPTPRRLALVGLSLLLAYPAREQGLIVVAFGLLALGVLAAAPADGRSAGRRLALAAGAVLATLLIIQVLSWTHGAALLDPPWRPPWLGRLQAISMDVEMSSAGQVPTYVGSESRPWLAWTAGPAHAVTESMIQAVQAPEAERAWAIRRVTALHTIVGGVDMLVMVALGLVGALVQAISRRQPRLLLAWLPALAVVAATLVVWTQRRHLMVALPVALAGIGLLVGHIRPAAARAVVGLLVVLVMPAWQLPTTLRALDDLGARADEVRDAWVLGRRLDAALPPEARICGTWGQEVIRARGVLLVAAERAGCMAEGDVPVEPGGQAAWLSAVLVEGEAGTRSDWEVLDREGRFSVLWLDPSVPVETRRQRARLLPVERYVPVPRRQELEQRPGP